MENGLAVVAICISAALFAFQVFDRIWGGGNRAATATATIREYVSTMVAELRKDVFDKHDHTEGNIGQAIQNLKDMAHRAEIAALEFRAYCAENYLRQGPLTELKMDVKDAFEKIDHRLARMESTIEANRQEDRQR